MKCKVSQQLLFEIKMMINKSRLNQFENIDGNVRIGTFVNNLVISQKKKDIFVSVQMIAQFMPRTFGC